MAMPACAPSQYQAMFDPPIDAVLVVDSDFTIVSADAGAEQMFGHRPQDIIGQNAVILIPDLGAFASHWSRAGAGSGPAASRHVEGVRKNGAPIALDLSITQWARRGETFFTAVMRDARERCEGALDPATQRLLANLYRQSGAGLAETDQKGRFLSVNERYCEIVGRSREELLGLRLRDIVHPEDRHRGHSRVGHLGGATDGQSTEERYVRGDGSLVWVTATGNLIPSDSGEPLCLLVVIDVTETRRAQAAQRAAEDQLRRLQDDFAHLSRVSDLGEMAAAIAHEINQPLAAISNYLNGGLMQVKSESPAQSLVAAREAMVRAAEQGVRAASIVRGLGEFARRGNGTRQMVSPEALAESAIALALIDRRDGIELEHRRYAGEQMVDVDPIQIQQVLVNLLRNAVESLRCNPPGAERRLKLSTRELADKGLIEFYVADTGPGIPDEICERLFDPFVTAKADGMGMGLAVCRRIVEAHEGVIEVNCGDGVGATFLVRLPCSGEAAASLTEVKSVVSQSDMIYDKIIGEGNAGRAHRSCR